MWHLIPYISGSQISRKLGTWYVFVREGQRQLHYHQDLTAVMKKGVFQTYKGYVGCGEPTETLHRAGQASKCLKIIATHFWFSITNRTWVEIAFFRHGEPCGGVHGPPGPSSRLILSSKLRSPSVAVVLRSLQHHSCRATPLKGECLASGSLVGDNLSVWELLP